MNQVTSGHVARRSGIWRWRFYQFPEPARLKDFEDVLEDVRFFIESCRPEHGRPQWARIDAGVVQSHDLSMRLSGIKKDMRYMRWLVRALSEWDDNGKEYTLDGC